MFDFSKIEIKLIPNNEAKQFMQKYHYTKSCPKSTYALGFYYNNQFCILYRKYVKYSLHLSTMFPHQCPKVLINATSPQ